MEIVQLLCPESKYDIKCPYIMSPEGLTIHNTANDASAKNEISYMITNDNKVSFHYAVDDVRAIQGIPLDRCAWHSGDGINGYGNRKTIGIEICYSLSGGDRFIQAEKNCAELIARLMLQYGWTPDMIGTKYINTHQYRSGKYCPHRTLDMGIGRFYDMIKAEYAELAGESTEYTYDKFIQEVAFALGTSTDTTDIFVHTVTVSRYINQNHAVVRPIQKYLYALGYTEVGDADGDAGPKFDTAVKKYQKEHGCDVDGEITAKRETWKNLLTNPNLQPEPEPQPQPQPEPTPDPEPQPKVEEITLDLKIGSKKIKLSGTIEE